MRILVIIAVLICISSPSAFSKSGTSFDEFVKSREVVTTLYFNSNAENLSKSERDRLAGAIDKLRDLQESGRMIRVEGFSSPEGDQENNFKLSFFRARTVAVLIEAKGLPAEVALTGYGDLRANSNDPGLERRVEIASYVQPVGMKRVKVADNQITPKDQEIDSYRVDQAIRRKIDDKNKGLADRYKRLEEGTSPGLSQAKEKVESTDLDRGYSQWRKAVAPGSPKLSQSIEPTDYDLRNGYSQAIKAVDSEFTHGYSQSQKAADSDVQRGYSQSQKAADSDVQRGYSQSQKAADSDVQRGYSQSQKAADSDVQRGYSQSQKAADSDVQRGYSQSQKAADSDVQRGYSQSQKAADSDVQRGYSQTQEAADSDLQRGYSQVDPEKAPGVTQVMPVEAPFIDALMIEQAIMEKIGADLPAPSGEVSLLDY